VSRNEGFLSPDFAQTISTIRLDFSIWFGLLEDCNRLAVAVLPRVQPGTADNQKLLEAVLFARALQTIQAMTVLAERGMTGDARTLLRSCCETAIFQRKLHLDAGFADKLEERHDFHQRKLANALLCDPRSTAELTPEQVQSLRAVVAEIDGRYPVRKPADVNLATVAASVNGMALYDLIFRSTSGDAAHTTLNSLVRHVVSDRDNNITGLRFGPQTDDLADTISGGISVLLHVLDAAIESFGLLDVRDQLATAVHRWKELVEEDRRKWEPPVAGAIP
jgi:hypothetical protein